MSRDNSIISDTCASILEEIEQEEIKYSKLKKQLSTCESNLRVVQILNNPSFVRERLFQVRVEVFRSLIDLLRLYPEKVTQDDLASSKVMDTGSYNLYFIAVYVSRQFHDKLLGMEWIADFTIFNSNCKISKSLNLKKHASNPITVILPFPKARDNNETVKVYLTSPNTTNWRQVELASIQTDISFKFNNVKDNKNSKSVDEDALRINGIYNSAIKEDLVEERLNYRLHCHLDRESFVSTLENNSYHNLYPSQIICNEGNRATKIEINDRQVQLELDEEKKSLRIEAPREELCQLKRYFTRVDESHKKTKNDFLYIKSVEDLKEARTKLMESLQYNPINVVDLLNVYDVYQRFVDGCPL